MQAISLWHMIIIKSFNKPSVSKPLQSITSRCDQSSSLLCSLSNGSVYKGGDLFQHPAAQLHLWIYVSLEWQDVLNPVPSNDITHCSNFRMCPPSINLTLTRSSTHTPSQLGSLQLVPMVIIISPFPSVYLWTVQTPKHTAVCTITHINTETQAPLAHLVIYSKWIRFLCQTCITIPLIITSDRSAGQATQQLH